MKFTAVFLATALLAGDALAAPRGTLFNRIKARTSGFSHIAHAVEKVGKNENKVMDGNDAQTEYSKNWGGAVIEQPPSPQQTFTAVTGTFTVPKPTAAASGANYQAASAWVGIDGDTYGDALLQTGVDIIIQDNKPSYKAWYEWLPDAAHDFNLEVNEGDVIVAYVQSTDNSHGVAVVENQTSGKNASKTLSAPQPSATLRGVNAEWIVEDFDQGGREVPLVNFGNVTFSGAVAQTSQGSVGVDKAGIIDISQNNRVYTDVNIQGSSNILVSYKNGVAPSSGSVSGGGAPSSNTGGDGGSSSGSGGDGGLGSLSGDPFGFGSGS